jgi:quercetin dioxygenase-like cupin family protein
VAHDGQVLEGPNGYRLTLVRIGEDVLEMEASYTGTGGFPPVHLHPGQAEHFDVLDGAVRAIVDGEERRYAAGESFDVGVGTPHTMAGDGRALVRWEVRPPLRTADFFERLYAGDIDFAEFSDEFRLA